MSLSEMFGCMVFNDAVMKERLPKDIYKALKKTMEKGTHLEVDVANVVANAMKDWAVEKGVTHYTHWFQPMTGITAQKHEGFITPDGSGKIIMEFSGKELIKGEPDASSFPSGGLRATFEARGYTAWDPTSYAFIKDNILCIPTAFCSYGGDALDKKTPLLRSMEALNKQALRILRLFGNTEVKRVISTVGPEQEYFLVDKSVYEKRPDLIYCGRTLFGAKPPKGQEMEDHYFGNLKPRVSAFMKELDEELWKLGVLAKTKHNEVAPAQHEFAPIFTTANIAADHNQLTMELMKSIAAKHDMVCLLHEKPFAGINGSGKHINWSISTDTGMNLLEPGNTPSQNAQFLLILVAIIKALDDYQELLRVSAASAGNDHRLGASEAPPAIISTFLGEELTAILEAVESGALYQDKEKILMEIGASVLPHFPKDSTDRNRTSPFAFTGNRFEFRMLGSNFSISGPNVVLNTIVAESFAHFSDLLEDSENFQEDLKKLIQATIINHKRIIFNGNGYEEEWTKEAERRGLVNLRTTVDALPYFITQKSIDLFTKHRVFTISEIHSRYEILLENYNKTVQIEALTMIDMLKKGVIASVLRFQNELSELLMKKKALGLTVEHGMEEKLLGKVSENAASLQQRLEELEISVNTAKGLTGTLEAASYYKDYVLVDMNSVRMVVDELENLIPSNYWNYPTYGELLYSVR